LSKRVLIGTSEIAGHFDDYRKGYEACGYSVKTIVRSKLKMFKHIDYDYVIDEMIPTSSNPWLNLQFKRLNTLLRHFFLFFLCLRADIFHVLWPVGFVKWSFFLPLIKRFNPKLQIVFNAVGDDVRWRYAELQECEHLGFVIDPALVKKAEVEGLVTLEEKLKILRIFEKHADLILSHPSQAQIEIRPYRFYYLPMQLDHFKFSSKRNNKVPIVVHAATERAVKGTDEVIKAVEELKAEGEEFEFRLLERMPNKELLAQLREADIVVYNPYGKYTGKLGLEALASGCLLVTNYDTSFLPVPPESPVVHTTPDNLKSNLKELFATLPQQESLRIAGRNWVEKYYETTVVCRRIVDDLKKLEAGEELELDFYPDFYRTAYTPVLGPDEVALQNRYVEDLKEMKWYGEAIPSGERDGLVF